MPNQKYERLPETAAGPEEAGFERPATDLVPTTRSARRKDRIIQVLAALNVLLAVLLCIVATLWWREPPERAGAPHSPAWGAVRYVNKRFGREDIFYMDNETSPLLDEAWKNNTGPSGGHVRLSKDEARKNPPSVELSYKPGYYLYGLSMFHQVHCLDMIRRSFFPKHYFPDKTEEEVTMHKKHCFDYVRQSIMCSGDVTMDHWFNYNFTTPSMDPSAAAKVARRGLDWTEQYSDTYKALTPEQRMYQGGLLWDTVHRCRDYDSLWRWVEERQLVDEAYVEEFGTEEEYS